MLLLTILSVCIGALRIPLIEVWHFLSDSLGFTENQASDLHKNVILGLRIPRALMAILIGSSLAFAGASLQGLFRNPLADPGLIGISSGASLAATCVIVLGIHIGFLGQFFLAICAFVGAAIVTFIVYQISRSGGKTIVATMLLAGIAMAAIAEAGRGYLFLVSDEAELRNATFWLLGSLGGANWNNILVLIPFTILPLFFMYGMGKKLNAFSLGETDANYLGINVKVLKRTVVVLATLVVGASVSVAGMIGFVGLIVPHIVRLIFGPDHRSLLPISMILGAIFLLGADLIARTVLSPIEIPIGIITAAIGAPLFISILLNEKKKRRLMI